MQRQGQVEDQQEEQSDEREDRRRRLRPGVCGEVGVYRVAGVVGDV